MPKDKWGVEFQPGDLLKLDGFSDLRRMLGPANEQDLLPVKSIAKGVWKNICRAGQDGHLWEVVARGTPEEDVPETFEPQRFVNGQPILSDLPTGGTFSNELTAKPPTLADVKDAIEKAQAERLAAAQAGFAQLAQQAAGQISEIMGTTSQPWFIVNNQPSYGLQWYHRAATKPALEPIPYQAFRSLCEETVRANAPAASVLTDRTSADIGVCWLECRGVKRHRAWPIDGSVPADRIRMDLVWLCDDMKKELGERASR